MDPESELRDALLRIVRTLSDYANFPTEEESDALVKEWAALCPHPGGTDIIFWPNELGLCPDDEVGRFEMSPEAMVDYALNWEPRTVAMQVSQRSGGASVGYYLYKLEAPGTPTTQVATSLATVYEKGAMVAVALKGVRLTDGSVVDTTFEFGVVSCGKIIGISDKLAGSRIVK